MLKIGTQTAHIKGTTVDAFRMLQKCGFDAVDFGFPDVPGKAIIRGEADYPKFYYKTEEELIEYYKPIKEVAAETGIDLFQAHAPFPVWIKESEEYNTYMKMALEKTLFACGYLGVKHLVVHPVTRSHKDDEFNTNMEIYRSLMPLAKKYGVKICLENLFSHFNNYVIEGVCSDAAEVCRYIDTLNAEAGEELFGLCLDVGHANLTGRNLRKYINAIGKRLSVLHIHDNNGQTDSHMMPYTQVFNHGKNFYIDWDGFVEGLRDIHYEGSLAFETFRVMQVVPDEIQEESLKLISAIGRYWKARIEAPEETN